MWGRRKNLELKKKSQIQSLRWILCKVNRKVALEPIFKNLLNLELLEKYLKIRFCFVFKENPSHSYIKASRCNHC